MIQEPYTSYEINAREILMQRRIPYIPYKRNENEGGK